MNAAICGIGVVGGFGNGLPALEKALTGGGIGSTKVAIPTREGPVRVPCLIADTAALADYVAAQGLRRMDHYIRLALLAALEAMADADLLDKGRRGRLGIIVATGNGPTANHYAFQHPFADKEEICGSPIRFANSVHNAAAAHLSIVLEEMGPNHSITHADLAFPSALQTAMVWLRQRRVDTVLVGGVDALSHAHAYAWHLHQQIPPCEPGGEAAADATPMAGEGACFLVLKAADTGSSASYAVIREAGSGRIGIATPAAPKGNWYFLARNAGSDPRSDYANWLPPGALCACYARVYGDLPIDSAFDTAIAALSLRRKRIYADGSATQRTIAHESSADRSIVCLKKGAGRAYSWTILDVGACHRERS